MFARRSLLAVASVGLCAGVTLAGLSALERTESRGARSIRFYDPRAQSAEFIGYSRSIRLNREQREIFEEALGAMSSPCCGSFSLSSCCCPCNLAKSCWGLANFLIARRAATPSEVRRNVSEWLSFVNPAGFSGEVCATSGGCARRFSHNGCGGMDEKNLAAKR